MLPTFSRDNPSNCCIANSVFFGENRREIKRCPNLKNIVRGKSSFRIVRAKTNLFEMVSSIFKVHVPHVILLSSKEKVSRIYASRVVAFMTDKHSFRNFPEMNCPRHPVRIKVVDLPVLRFAPGPYPLPAVVEWDHFNFFPESFSNWFGGVTHESPL